MAKHVTQKAADKTVVHRSDFPAGTPANVIAADAAYDKAHGIVEGSPQDRRLDALAAAKAKKTAPKRTAKKR